jgi:DNA modification methylase
MAKPKKRTDLTEDTRLPKWRNRIIGHGDEDPAQLLANPKNWRLHPKAQQDALAGVLKEVGWVQDIIINKRTGFMIDGHARVALAISAGERVPVVFVDLSEQEEALIIATLDPLSAMAVADEDLLAELIGSLDVSDAAVKALLDELAGNKLKAGLTDDDAVPALSPKSITQTGDCWLLGAHRLLCGDATDLAVVERLMAGQMADMVFSDPPYGVDLTNTQNIASRRRSDGAVITNDALDLPALTAFLRAAFTNGVSVTRAGAVWYITGPHGPVGVAFSQALMEIGVWRQSLVWVKDSPVMGRLDYHYRHEPIYYGWTPGASHARVPTRDQNTVWEIPRPKSSPEHPTMKPVALVERALTNSSKAGDLCLDPFSGSATTLIACEKTSRVARLLEIEPRYVDVAIRRWQAFTGRIATLEEDGRTFTEVAQTRAKELSSGDPA